MTKWTAICSRLRGGISAEFYLSWEWSLKKKHKCLLAVAVQLHLSTRNCNIAFSFCVSWHRLLDSAFFVDDTDGRHWYRLHFAVRVSYLLQFCIKPMRYIYYTQRNCYFAAALPLRYRPCELTLTHGDNIQNPTSILPKSTRDSFASKVINLQAQQIWKHRSLNNVFGIIASYSLNNLFF